MNIQFFPILRFTLFVLLGGPVVVEVVGYFWHRFAEHEGWLGDTIRYRHWVHHEQDYPTTNLRPAEAEKYQSAGSWSWYVVGSVTIGTLFLTLSLWQAVPLTIGGAAYALAVMNAFHTSFHIKDHWLNRFKWFPRLVLLHDIHHYGPCNYGIAFFIMDWLFGTLCETMPDKPQHNFPRLPSA